MPTLNSEIVAAPLTLWLAPVATAFPLIGAAPANTWKKVGTGGTANYDDAGVTVTHDEVIAEARPAGTMGPIKAWRTSEDLMIEVNVWDLTLEQYAIALNGVAVSTTAAGTGTAGFKKIGLSQGEKVTLYALLARGVSPEDEALISQYEVPRCYQAGNPKLIYKKGVPAGLSLQFKALEDLGASSVFERFGRVLTQHQAAL